MDPGDLAKELGVGVLVVTPTGGLLWHPLPLPPGETGPQGPGEWVARVAPAGSRWATAPRPSRGWTPPGPSWGESAAGACTQ